MAAPSLLACASIEKIAHRSLSQEEEQAIERSLYRVNQSTKEQVEFTGALKLGSSSYERYNLSPEGPQLLLNINASYPAAVHASCFAHPPSSNEPQHAGRKELSFELMKNRPGDPSSRLFESIGVLSQEEYHPDWMCNTVVLPQGQLLEEITLAQSSRISDLDFLRAKQARKDALDKLIEQRDSSIYQQLSDEVDRRLYENLRPAAGYGVPNLARQVGIMQRSTYKELAEIKAGYTWNHKVIILAGTLNRDQVLTQMVKLYESPQPSLDLPLADQTSTSTSFAKQVYDQLLQASSESTKRDSEKPQTDDGSDFMLLSWVLPPQFSRDFVALQAMAYILAQKLESSNRLEIRIQQRRFGGRFDILLNSPKGQSASQALADIRRLVSEISNDQKLPALIKDIQNHLERQFWKKFDDPFTQARALAFAELSGGDVETLQAEYEAIVSLDRNQLIRVTSEYLVLQHPIIVHHNREKK